MGQYTNQNIHYLQSMGITCWVKREANVATQLKRLAHEVTLCRQCPLHQTRIQPLVSEGDPTSKIMIIGDAPHRIDDQQGAMFSGELRELLRQLLLSIGLTFNDVYLSNLLKCAVPESRDLHDEEISACRGFLMRQIELVAPQFILALGQVVGSALLGGPRMLDEMRLQAHVVNDIPMVVTYSPRELFNNPRQKRSAYLDMIFIRERISNFYDKK